MAQLRDYLHTAVPASLMDVGVDVVDLHAYVAKIDREFKTRRYDDIDAPLLYIRIQIGEATCIALIDCGATRNHMSQDFLARDFDASCEQTLPSEKVLCSSFDSPCSTREGEFKDLGAGYTLNGGTDGDRVKPRKLAAVARLLRCAVEKATSRVRSLQTVAMNMRRLDGTCGSNPLEIASKEESCQHGEREKSCEHKGIEGSGMNEMVEKESENQIVSLGGGGGGGGGGGANDYLTPEQCRKGSIYAESQWKSGDGEMSKTVIRLQREVIGEDVKERARTVGQLFEWPVSPLELDESSPEKNGGHSTRRESTSSVTRSTSTPESGTTFEATTLASVGSKFVSSTKIILDSENGRGESLEMQMVDAMSGETMTAGATRTRAWQEMRLMHTEYGESPAAGSSVMSIAFEQASERRESIIAYDPETANGQAKTGCKCRCGETGSNEGASTVMDGWLLAELERIAPMVGCCFSTSSLLVHSASEASFLSSHDCFCYVALSIELTCMGLTG
ncbi:hypothetical protein CBR_g28563 [Chara braunii]|uniref:Uncharacterized protein n=1 Tax=Chara braunii TaxID=69332 RepID=A0A388JWE3_CHABU|nr:hypothetical protein CBR_g28563 [Chara braunii]|eukprot:GBG62087.1 hypothetical protein CBR_g28563 [Chara braunii]